MSENSNKQTAQQIQYSLNRILSIKFDIKAFDKNKDVDWLVKQLDILSGELVVIRDNLITNIHMIEVKNCKECPFLEKEDMGIDYRCKANKTNQNIIKQDKNFQLIQPDWCKLKQGGIYVK